MSMNRFDVIDRMIDIKVEMLDRLHELDNLLRAYPNIHTRAKAYWLAQMEMAISNEHGFLGSATHTLTDTINELEQYGVPNAKER